jgi:spermidine/putrescine-binding protein
MERTGITRRNVLATMAAGAAAGVFSNMSAARAAVSDMVWATWDSNGHPEYVTGFEKETGVKVKLSYLSSEDAQFAALKTGAAADWDMVNPSLNGSWRYIKAGLLKELDLSKIPQCQPDVRRVQDHAEGDGRGRQDLRNPLSLGPQPHRLSQGQVRQGAGLYHAV